MTKTQEEQETKIRGELEEITLAINKLQALIDRTPSSSPKLKEYCKEMDNLVFQRNAKVNLINTMRRW